MLSKRNHELDSDEGDEDYVPPAGGADPDYESSDDSEEPETKRPRTCSPGVPEEDLEAKKLAQEALWSSFQQSITATPALPTEQTTKKMVKIEKRYLFAGETVVEVVEVAEDSPDAKRWPLWRPSETSTPASIPDPTPEASTPSTPIEAAAPSPVTTPKPPVKRPGPRKPKITLAAPQTSAKPKKLSTLDKSAMDWRAHVQAEGGSGMKDELEANRRGGGYLEKVEFLKRVEERKEGALEAAKSSKRRRA